MVLSNEFKGANLAEAARKATADFRPERGMEGKSFCLDLRREYEMEVKDLDHIQQRIGDLQRQVELLKRDAAAQELTALVTSAGVGIRALTKIRGIINLIRRKKFDEHTVDVIQRHGPEIAVGVTAFIAAFLAYDNLKKARDLEKEITQLQADTDKILKKLESIALSYTQAHCHLTRI